MSNILIIVSSLLVLSSYALFIQAILRKKAKPHRTTRFVILIITLIATFSLFAQGNQVAIWLIGISSFFSFIIFLLSIKYGMGGWSKVDVSCLIIALIGVVLWKITDDPVIALYLSITADFVSFIPTLIKTYHFPDTEVWYFYGVGVLSALLNLLAIKNLSPEEYSYPVYLVIMNLLIVLLILRRSKFKGKHKNLPWVGYAFANPSGANYAPEETKDAWQKTTAFLTKHLKS